MTINAIYCLIDIWDFIPTVVYAIFIVLFIIQISFHTFLNTQNFLRKEEKGCDENFNLPVSVIIAAKNEAVNLSRFLPQILEQNYPNFEVIVVNDGSIDDSEKNLSDLSETYDNLVVVHLNESLGKKNALTQGINASKNEYLLFTDADCYPCSNMWIQKIANKFTEEKSIVLAYGQYEKISGIVNSFIRFDTYLIALHYYSAASIGQSYMGVGRNIAYKKQVWGNCNGFESHKDILSGDDDLFILEAATEFNVALATDKDSFTYSIPKETIEQYTNQKIRHVSTSKQYDGFSKLISGIEIISRSLFYYCFIFLMFTELWPFLLGFTLFRYLFLYLVGARSRNVFNIKIRFYYFILFDIFAPVFYQSLMIKKIFNNKEQKW